MLLYYTTILLLCFLCLVLMCFPALCFCNFFCAFVTLPLAYYNTCDESLPKTFYRLYRHSRVSMSKLIQKDEYLLLCKCRKIIMLLPMPNYLHSISGTVNLSKPNSLINMETIKL